MSKKSLFSDTEISTIANALRTAAGAYIGAAEIDAARTRELCLDNRRVEEQLRRQATEAAALADRFEQAISITIEK